MKTKFLPPYLNSTVVGIALAGLIAGAASAQVTPPSIPRNDPAAPATSPQLTPGAEPSRRPGAAMNFFGMGAPGSGIRGLPAGGSAPEALDLPPNTPDRLEQLEANVRAFDDRRVDAANAIFRLGECYRKLGQFDEAKVQYARILREFSDLPALVDPSRRLLAEKSRRATGFHRTLAAGDLPGGAPPLPTPALESPAPVDREAYIADELRRLSSLLSLLKENSNPEALPGIVIEDPRYLRLKNDFEEALVARGAEAEPGRKEELDRRRERIREWLKQIYIPEQENAISFFMAQRSQLEEQKRASSEDQAGRSPNILPANTVPVPVATGQSLETGPLPSVRAAAPTPPASEAKRQTR